MSHSIPSGGSGNDDFNHTPPSRSPCPSPSSHRVLYGPETGGGNQHVERMLNNGDVELGVHHSEYENYDMRGELDDLDDDTISDISFDEENYYNKDEIIVASRTTSFKVTRSNFQQQSPRIMTPPMTITSQLSNTETTMILGTLRGVFLPCLQTSLFGALLFVKLPWLVSQLGVYLAIGGIIISACATIFSLLSLIAIATNGKMKKSAGVYVLMRKYLGLELGGCIGIYHLIQKVGVTAMYCLAASEAALASVEFDDAFSNKTTLFSIILCAILSIFCMFPQHHRHFEDITVALSLLTVISFFFGTILFVSGAWSSGMPPEDREFAACLLPSDDAFRDPRTGSKALISNTFSNHVAILFASVSGVFGASTRSGYLLANPGLSIPLGTLLSTFLVLIVSIYITIVLGLGVSYHGLFAHRIPLALLSWPMPILGYIGITICSISAAFNNLKGIPRLIAVINEDGAVPFFSFLSLTHHHAPIPNPAANNSSHSILSINRSNLSQPRYLHPRKIFFTFCITAVPCLAGDLKSVAEFVAIPILIVYVAVNVSCFLLAFVNAPGFRPHWKYFSWHTSLLGALFCVGAMLIVSWWLAIFYAIGFLILFIVVSKSTASNDWGDAVSGLMYQQARNLLHFLSDPKRSLNAKNWRPQILIVTEITARNTGDSLTKFSGISLIRLAGQMKKGKGLTIVSALLEGNPVLMAPQDRRLAQEDIDTFMKNEGIFGFSRCSVAKNLNEGFDAAVQLAGVGNLRPNTVLLEWRDESEITCFEDATNYLDRFRVVAATEKAIIAVKGANYLPNNMARLRGNIDIWWIVNIHDGGLLLLLPHLLWLHKVWHHCRLRLFVVMTSPTDNPVKLKRRAEEHLDRERVEAIVEVVDFSNFSDVYNQSFDHKARDELLMALDNPTTFSVALRQNTFYGNNGIKTHLADLFHHPKSLTMAPVPEHRPLDNSRSANSPLTADIDIKLREGGDQDITSVDGVANFHDDHGSETHSHHSSERPIDLATTPSPATNPSTPDHLGNSHQAATQFNILIRQKSRESNLIVMNLPPMNKFSDYDFISYTNALTRDLQPVLLVRGTGQEVITSYN